VIRELVENDRIIGGITPKCAAAAKDLYRVFVKGECILTDARTAEMCKLTENSFRDVNIAFANELSVICEEAGINVNELIRLASKHPRVKILQPGPGVGGHCIAVDPWFIATAFPEQAKIIRLAREVNTAKTKWVINKIKQEVVKFEKKMKRKPMVACMGLTYKADIDDLRESPALEIFESLKHSGFSVLAVEPNIREHKKISVTDTSDALKQADIIVFLVSHKEFSALGVNGKIILDFSGINNK